MADTGKKGVEEHTSEVKETAEYTPIKTEFIQETIKSKPVNKKKLLRRTLITALMAVVFGGIACVTFLVIEPILNNKLNPEEKAQEVVLPEETKTEEMKPEDILTDEMLAEEEEARETENAELQEQQIEELLSQVNFSLEDYQLIYDELASLAEKIVKSVVTVSGYTSDVDWFNNVYSSEAEASGVIVANNGVAMLILVSDRNLNEADTLSVTFCDDSVANAEFLRRDEATGLAILAVDLNEISASTMGEIEVAILGSSNVSAKVGTPIIALGSPVGNSESLCYGVITSSNNAIDVVDASYKYMTTDIYGSRYASGVLANYRGQIVGIIDNNIKGDNTGNMLSAYGISDLKRLIEIMSNDSERAYLGVHGLDVPETVHEKYGVPFGAYINFTEMGSPAMSAGIQSGDIIIKMGDQTIVNYGELLNVIGNASPGDVMTAVIMRESVGEYNELTVDITFGERQ